MHGGSSVLFCTMMLTVLLLAACSGDGTPSTPTPELPGPGASQPATSPDAGTVAPPEEPDAGTVTDPGEPDAGTVTDPGNPDAGTSDPQDGGTADAGTVGSCLGAAFLESLGKSRVLVGAAMTDATAAKAPFDVRYHYLSGGLPDDSAACHGSCATGCAAGGHSCAGGNCEWWGCWQWDQDPPGQFARDLLDATAEASPPQIPMFTYYEVLQASGAPEGDGEVAAVANVDLMRRYFDDWRFLLRQIGNRVAFLHIEPDFWAYAEQMNPDPHALPAAVASANPTDCADQENSVAGMGRCLISMTRKYTPNAKVGLHASGWATGIGVLGNTDPGLDVTAEARKLAHFLTECGEDQADFVVVDVSDRDAGYYASIGEDDWWDATNSHLPDFQQAFTWASALSEALGKPVLWWQVPLGNMSLPDEVNAWKDNRLDYFFDHPDEVARTHAVGMLFGAGRDDQTTPESDDGHFVSRSNSYFDSGGQPLCVDQ